MDMELDDEIAPSCARPQREATPKEMANIPKNGKRALVKHGAYRN